MIANFMQGVDLFSGSGGMTVGAIADSISLRYAAEAEKHASSTFELNHKEHLSFVIRIF